MSLATSRRAFVAMGAAGALALNLPRPAFAASRALKVSVIGEGRFQGAFEANIFPAFARETGIAVASVARPDGRRWVDVLGSATESGDAPADVSMLGRGSVAEGIASGIWKPLDTSRIPNAAWIGDKYFDCYPNGDIAGITAVTWRGYDVSGSWVLLRTSRATDEAHAFIDFMCNPSIQISLATGKGWSLTGGPASALTRRR